MKILSNVVVDKFGGKNVLAHGKGKKVAEHLIEIEKIMEKEG